MRFTGIRRDDVTLKTVCDECGEPATWSMIGATFLVKVEGQNERRNEADFCDEHRAREGERQPHNCKRVAFWYSEDAVFHGNWK